MSSIYIKAGRRQWLNDHLAKWAGCQLCPMASEKRVMYSGTFPARILWVTELPAAIHLATNNPLSKPEGQVVADMCQLIDEVDERALGHLVTPMVICNPVKTGAGYVIPEGAVEACEIRLLEVIQEAQPEVVVLLGTLTHQLKLTFNDLEIGVVQAKSVQEIAGARPHNQPFITQDIVARVLHRIKG